MEQLFSFSLSLVTVLLNFCCSYSLLCKPLSCSFNFCYGLYRSFFAVLKEPVQVVKFLDIRVYVNIVFVSVYLFIKHMHDNKIATKLDKKALQ